MRLILLLAAALISATAALADDRGYVFLEGGAVSSRSKPGGGDDLASTGVTVISSSESKGETAIALGVGFAISRYWAAEAVYLDLGQVHQQSATFRAGANSGNRVNEWDASGFGLALRASYPLPYGFALFGKAALYRIDGGFRTATLILAPNGQLVSSTSSSASGSGTVPALGFGASYAVTARLSARATFERFADKSGLFGDGNDLEAIRLLSVGAWHRF